MTSCLTCTQACSAITATMPRMRARVSLRASLISLRVAGADAELLHLTVRTQEAVYLRLDGRQRAHLSVHVVLGGRRVGQRRIGQPEVRLHHDRAVERRNRL